MVFELTDQNFAEYVLKNEKPVLVDFFAEWCGPCFVLGPILEKLAEEFLGKFILAKANLDNVPELAQKFQINQVPTVILFENGKPKSGFIGLLAEANIKKWLLENLKEDNLISLRQEYQGYASKKGFHLRSDEATLQRILQGLAMNQQKYGKRYCPCRRITGDGKEDAKIICPCVYHLEEIEKNGQCLCGLFVK